MPHSYVRRCSGTADFVPSGASRVAQSPMHSCTLLRTLKASYLQSLGSTSAAPPAPLSSYRHTATMYSPPGLGVSSYGASCTPPFSKECHGVPIGDTVPSRLAWKVRFATVSV